MTYDRDIPDFALQPAKETDEADVFDPSPYDRLLNFHRQDKVNDVVLNEKEKTEGVGEEVNSWFNSELDLGLELELETEEKTLIETLEELPEVEVTSEFEGEAEVKAEMEVADVVASEKVEIKVADVVESERAAMEVAEVVASEKMEIKVAEVVASEKAEMEVAEVVASAPVDVVSQPNYEFEMESVPVQVEPTSAIPTSAIPTSAIPTSELPNGEVSVIVPMAGTVITNELKMTDIREKAETRVYLEEDILVPDTKEDLASILSMTGKASLFDSEVRVGQLSQDSVKVTGEIELHTLYIPENYAGENDIINIQSRLPFKTEYDVSAAPLSRLVIKPYIESIDYTVINERKFRAKLTVRLTMREYANVEMQVFEGIKGEKLQLLKEKIQMTHVSERKTDVMDINEILAIKDTQPKPERILKYDVDIVENHKQITDDKAVINATIYCNVLYLGSSSEGEVKELEETEEFKLTPQLFQGKTEFTQFIPIINSAEGSKISFNYNNLTVHIKEPNSEEPNENAFALEGNVETSIEIYKNLEREIVTDIYHRTKDIVCDKVELEAMSLGGSGVTEAAVREIINIPEKYGEVKKVIYIFGNIKNSRSFLDQNKNIVEGVVDITLLCLPEDEKKSAFRLNKEVNFRGSMEIPMGSGDTKANSEIAIKELWFDRINAKQIEVNANLFISSSVYGQDKYQVIQNVCFIESKEEPGTKPGMVVYITKNGDTLWNIAKKYRTTMEMITEINELGEEQVLSPGVKLLIVK